ncbi:unnamed protein product, partial [Phaeothamnion confervicola]
DQSHLPPRLPTAIAGRSLHAEITAIERQIFELETSYLEETRLYGNVIHGWDPQAPTGAAAGKAATAAAPAKRKRDESDERLFSMSSVTSPAA